MWPAGQTSIVTGLVNHLDILPTSYLKNTFPSHLHLRVICLANHAGVARRVEPQVAEIPSKRRRGAMATQSVTLFLRQSSVGLLRRFAARNDGTWLFLRQGLVTWSRKWRENPIEVCKM